MDRWALKYGSACTFVCVSCAGPGLAQQFASELRLRNCVNTYVEQRHMPAWGQLGCSGFIVLDGSHHVTCKATSAFMEVRNLAFKHCETLVDAMVSSGGRPAAPPAVPPGALVTLSGLSARPELNGLKGVCVRAASEESGDRCVVQTEDGRSLRLRPQNLVLRAEEGGCSAKGGGCGTDDCSSKDDCPNRASELETGGGCGPQG
jgi:hypothetical protein